MRWGVVKSHLNCSRWRQPSKIEKGPHCSFGGPKRKLNHYQNFMLAENYKRRKFEHLIEIGLNIQVLESSAFGSCTKSTEREKKIVQFRLNRQWKKNNTECITLQHRKWRMQSKRKELKRVYENYHATIQGKNDTYIQPKRNKPKRKTKQNKKKTRRGTVHNISIGLRKMNVVKRRLGHCSQNFFSCIDLEFNNYSPISERDVNALAHSLI